MAIRVVIETDFETIEKRETDEGRCDAYDEVAVVLSRAIDSLDQPRKCRLVAQLVRLMFEGDGESVMVSAIDDAENRFVESAAAVDDAWGIHDGRLGDPSCIREITNGAVEIT